MRTDRAAMSLFLMVLASIIVLVGIPSPVHASSTSFTFDAAGDYAFNSATTTVWQGMNSSGANFVLSLGDMLYMVPPTEQQWCQTFKSYISNVEIAVGNHETFESNASGTGGGSINKFIQYCPFTLGTIGGGAYGFQYYFDYPQTNPLARFVVVEPSIWNGTTSSSSVDYRNGTVNQAWVGARIDEARSKSIPWVIVAFHKPCISTGSEECGNQQDFLRFLLSKKVDLILNGHDHNYERSKQLICATAESYVPSCVSNDGSSGVYTKGAGSVLMVSGCGGAGDVPIDTTDPDYPYWATTNSAAPSVKGFAKFTVNSTAISEQWVTTASGPYSDNFSITSAPGALTGSFTFTPTTPSVGQTVTFTASVSGGTSPYTFSWNFGDSATATGNPVTHSYSPKGNYTATLTIRDSAAATVVISNSVPVGIPLQGSFTFTPTAPTVGQTVTFTAIASGGTSPYTFSWNLGDSTTASGNPVVHIYSAKGSYTAKLTIRDSAGTSLNASNTIQVSTQSLQGSFTATSTSPAFDYVVTIVMENNGYCDVITSCLNSGTGKFGTGPYETSLAQNYSIAGNCQSDSSCSVGGYTATSHPSEGNYISMIGGSDFGQTADGYCCWGITGPNIIDRIESIGKTWQAWVEDASGSGCPNSSFSNGGFQPTRQADHFGFLTFRDMNTTARCSRFLSTSSSSDIQFLAALNATSPANYIWLTPIDSHSTCPTGNLAACDGYLSNLVPRILSSTLFRTKNAALLIVYDEGNNNYPRDYLYASWIGSNVKRGFVGSGSYSHWSYPKTLETVWNMPTLGTNDTTAQAMSEFFVSSSPTVTFASTITGGTSPYTVRWNFGDGTTGTGANPTHTYTSAGTYTVRMNVTDANGATFTTTGSVTIGPIPLAITVTCGTATSGKPVTCTGAATGGTSPYTFAWSAPGGSPTTGTGASFSTTYATKGNYLVNATATDASNVKKSATASVVVAAQTIVVTVICGAGTAGRPITCNASASGGTAPYTFSWSAPSGSPAAGAGVSFTTTYATKGTLVVNATSTDANGVKKSQTSSVAVGPQSIVVTVTCGTVTAGKPVTCNASATGGTSPYTFSWASKGTPAIGTGSSYTTTFASKGSQTINATATDLNGVLKLGQATVSVAAQPIVVTVTCGTATAGKPVTCNASATGGTAPFTLSWASKGTPATGTGSSYTTTFATKGSQTVNATATDLNGVSKLGQATVSVTAQPIVVTVTCGTATAGKPVTCNASATGGTAPFTFSWASKGTPATGTGSSYTTTFPTKGAQTVNATATDLNGVSRLGQATVSVTAQQIVVTVTCGTATAGKPVTCNASATGGTSPYTFTWASKGTSATGSGARYTTTFASKGSQTVNATTTDLNGVSKLGQATISVTAQPIVVTVTCGTATAGKPVTCNASAAGGTPPYTFSWSAPSGSPAMGTGQNFTTSYATKGIDVVNGTATDANGLKRSQTASMAVQAQPIIVTITCGSATVGKPVTCSASSTGGTAPYTFSWVSKGTPATGTGSIYTTTFASKGSQNVNATATDLNGASKLGQTTITVAAQPIVVTVNCGSATTGKPVTCNASLAGGTAPFTLSWASKGTPATGTGSSYTTTFAGKGSQTVNATATDLNSISKLGQLTINVVAQPIVVIVTCGTATSGKPVTCNASATGGNAPYTFSWASKGTLATGTGSIYATIFASKGSQVVNATATDLNGVSKLGQATLNVAAQPIVVTVICGTATAGKPVTCNASATGGTSPFTFSWASKGTPATGTGSSYTATFASKASQTVNATATDLNGVSKVGQATVSVTAQSIVVTATCGTATAGKPVTCSASATGGTAPYIFTWASKGSPSAGSGSNYTTTFSTKGSQTINATATDINNVAKLGLVTVSVAGQPIILTVTCGNATAGKPVTCNASATGGTSPYAFSWSAPRGNPAVGSGASFTTTFPTKGTFAVNATLTDANGLKMSGTASIIVAAQPLTVTATASPAVGTAGQPTVFSGSPSGGTAAYTFSWSFGDKGPTQPGSSVTHIYSVLGNYTVVLNVTDANAATASVTGIYHVNVPLPLAVSFTTPSLLVATRLGNFTAIVSGGVAPYTFSWSFGDNTTGTGVGVQHSYSVGPKNYTMSLQVTDSKGSTSTVSHRVLVWQTPDLDGDGKVTIVDAARVAFAFDSKRGDHGYDPRADLDGDGKVDILDAALVAFYFDTTGW